jgi:D-arabinose 5-phosphate isomerase GutQ
VFIAVSRSGETEQVLDKARIAKNVGMTIVAFTRASANTLAGMADVHLRSMTKRCTSPPKPQG